MGQSRDERYVVSNSASTFISSFDWFDLTPTPGYQHVVHLTSPHTAASASTDLNYTALTQNPLHTFPRNFPVDGVDGEAKLPTR